MAGKKGMKMPPCSEEKKRKIAASLRGRKLSAEHRARISTGLAGNKRGSYSADHRAAISAGLQGRSLSEEHKAAVSASLKGNQRRKGVKHTEVTKQGMSETHKGLWADGIYNTPAHTAAAKRNAKIAQAALQQKLTDPEYRKQFAKTRKGYNYGIWSAYTDAKGRSFNFRSTWELATAEVLDAAGLSWVYEDSSFHYSDEEGTPRVYTPDFFVKEWNCYLEVHPRFAVDAKMLCKLNEVRSRGLEIRLVLIKPKCLADLAGAAFSEF